MTESRACQLAIYQLFHRAINALPDPDAYCINRWRIAANGMRKPHATTVRLPTRVSLPWEELDGILSAVWYPTRGSAPLPAYPQLPRVRIFPHYRDQGIGVRTDFDPRELHVYGVRGVVRPNRPGFDPSNTMLTERHELGDNTEVVCAMAELIQQAYVDAARQAPLLQR
jgi:hypothetical protein